MGFKKMGPWTWRSLHLHACAKWTNHANEGKTDATCYILKGLVVAHNDMNIEDLCEINGFIS